MVLSEFSETNQPLGVSPRFLAQQPHNRTLTRSGSTTQQPDANAFRLILAAAMNIDDPIAWFITWTVYGTFLQGDERGWRKRKKGNQMPQPRLAEWHEERLNYQIILLNMEQRTALKTEIERLGIVRGWNLWVHDVRTNHAHVVVTAVGFPGSKVRDQMKANCTRVLREQWLKFRDRPVWTEGGDWQSINSESDLEQAILYVRDAQDRK